MYRPSIRPYLDPVKKVKYSRIVNRSQYRPDNIAKHELDAGSTPSVQGQFDGNWTDIETDSVPTEMIWLRENRLDRTEVEELRKQVQDRARNEALSAELAEADAVQKATSEKLGAIVNTISQ